MEDNNHLKPDKETKNPSKEKTSSKQLKVNGAKSFGRQKTTKEEVENQRLLIEDIIELKPLKMPQDISRDVKKLTKFLNELTDSYNRLIKGC